MWFCLWKDSKHCGEKKRRKCWLQAFSLLSLSLSLSLFPPPPPPNVFKSRSSSELFESPNKLVKGYEKVCTTEKVHHVKHTGGLQDYSVCYYWKFLISSFDMQRDNLLSVLQIYTGAPDMISARQALSISHSPYIYLRVDIYLCVVE